MIQVQLFHFLSRSPILATESSSHGPGRGLSSWPNTSCWSHWGSTPPDESSSFPLLCNSAFQLTRGRKGNGASGGTTALLERICTYLLSLSSRCEKSTFFSMALAKAAIVLHWHNLCGIRCHVLLCVYLGTAGPSLLPLHHWVGWKKRDFILSGVCRFWLFADSESAWALPPASPSTP